MDRLDPELVEPLKGLLAATGGGFSLRDIPAARAGVEAMLAGVIAAAPPTPGLAIEDRTVPSHATGVEVPVRLYRPAVNGAARPALLWMHPGGFVIGSVAMDELTMRALAKALGIVIVSVNYRLAPEHPHPAALEDCYGALAWLAGNAAELGVDPSRIAIGGASAGGNLAAALALLARDRGGTRPVFQLLVYPALDDANIEPASATLPDNLFWTRESSRIGWQAYTAGQAGTDAVSEYAAPIRARDLAGLPPAFIAVGTADMLMAENLVYAERLAAAGVEVELRVYPGAFHAFDAFAPASRLAQRFAAERTAALKRALA